MQRRIGIKWLCVFLCLVLLLTMGLTACSSKETKSAQQTETQPPEINNLFQEGMVAVEKNGQWQYVDRQGNYVPIGTFEDADNFAANGLAAVKTDGKWGYINTKGEPVIPCEYDYAHRFASNGLAAVKTDDKYGYINAVGEIVIPFQYDRARTFASVGLAVVNKDGKYGYINAQGELVIPCQYDGAHDFSSNGLAVVGLENSGKKYKVGYINTKGELVIPCQYDCAYNFSSQFRGLALVQKSGISYLINAKGERMNVLWWDLAEPVDPVKEGGEILRYKDIVLFSENGRAKVEKNGKYGYINTRGKLVIPCQYDEACDFASNGLTLVRTGRVGCIIDASGNTVKELAVEMDLILNLTRYDDAYVIEKDGQCGVLSIDGDVLLPPIYDDIAF